MAISVKDLGRSPGVMRTMQEHVPAPKDFGVALIGVPEGTDLDLDLRFEAVHEGILVSGTVIAPVQGECGRCLKPIAYDEEVDVQELFYYEDAESFGTEEEEEQHRIERDVIDLEPVLRDAVVTTLPFQPVCREDCEGLCSECGARLEEDPGHHHQTVDPRWAALSGLAGSVADNSAATSTESDEREES
ncbi:YceD family protein [Arthrobacter sp. zg-Y820]|uniref:YceD family protein n=1 Tax=unclassified Arthrobacter TaxID=235627 RepID=UPI001E502066|nr:MULTISPECIES: YceD family protein [unclassified Arthrobacter]MCC9196220.1 YceD family protein [Arthrobacter sp. zg-Y820]MDK1279081.1 YceD family protein [Arthrobacter sp. zg.Y820]MDK1359303.1 YceD family protein [Arthrobacter sp. zg-Y1219]WIB08511.1 YceD family protein [Arthrobacter sp. zg-Y820]